MNGTEDDPGLDIHLLPKEGELDCALHSPQHDSK